jgi:hypothetical protein
MGFMALDNAQLIDGDETQQLLKQLVAASARRHGLARNTPEYVDALHYEGELQTLIWHRLRSRHKAHPSPYGLMAREDRRDARLLVARRF